MCGQAYRRPTALRALLLGGSAMLALNYFSAEARAQVQLPEVVVSGAKPKPKPLPRPRRVVARPAPPAAAAAPAAPTPVNAAAVKNDSFDAARSNLYTTIGTTSDTISHDLIQALPQGTNTTVEKILLQAPGVSQDSAASGLLHVRNDHANVQFRINGVMLPDGVTGFGSIFDPSLIGSMSLITGALPAEFGMRTVGLVDMTTRTDIFNNSGSVSFYGGSQATIQPSFEYGGTIPNPCSSAPVLTKAAFGAAADCLPGVQYFFTGRYLQTSEGLENALPTYNPIHDFSQQEKGFGYMSMFLDPVTRLTLIAGTSTSWFQVPNVTGAPVPNPALPVPVTSAFGITNFNSANLNENQYEDTQFGVLALQRSVNGFDGQLSYFNRYNTLHFVPDPVGDLLLNGVASDITRQSFTNGVQGDASYIVNDQHTVRAGFTVSGEQTFVGNSSLVEPCTICDGSDNGPPETITDNVSKLGWLAGAYAQDEWKITRNITINAGLRFDQMWQYVDANQFSPRFSVTWKPFQFTTFHAGYARYFTPPVLVEAAPANLALFTSTTGQSPNVAAGASAASQTSPMLPERSHYFDAGVDQKIPFGCAVLTSPDCSVLDIGVDAYYKIAQDLIDNGNFGQALVLSGFNYAKGLTQGIEFSLKYHSGNLQAYGNLAVSQEQATDVVSNQYLFDNTVPLADLGGLTLQQYVDTHWIYTDHNQFVTGSAGASYLWYGTRYSVDMIYGSGLRAGDANINSESPYAEFNVGMSHDFAMPDGKPLTLRFDVVNVLDTIYQIRSGTGIGVFAPQYGPRRGYFVGLSKKI
jgi:outer membrane receptor protein involved in Fe transport